MLTVLIAAAIAAAQPAARPAAPPRDAAALIERMRAACGGDAWDRVEGWHETGTVDLPGRPGLPYEAWHSMHAPPTAAYENKVGGQIVRRNGFDGDVAWQAGPDGRVQVIDDPAPLRRMRRDAWLSNFGWLLPGRFPAAFALAGTRERDGRSYDLLTVTPEGADAVELWVDRDTARVARMVAGSEVAELADYREFSGVCTPTTGRQSDGDPTHDIVLHVETVETGPVDPARFVPPAAP